MNGWEGGRVRERVNERVCEWWEGGRVRRRVNERVSEWMGGWEGARESERASV